MPAACCGPRSEATGKFGGAIQSQVTLAICLRASAYASGPHITMRFSGARYIPSPSVMPNSS